MSFNPAGTSLRFHKDLRSIFIDQGANYDQKINSNLVLFSANPTLSECVREALQNMSSEHFEANAICSYISDTDPNPEELAAYISSLIFNQGKTVVFLGATPDWMPLFQNAWAEHYAPYRISYITGHGSPLRYVNFGELYLKETNILGYQRHHPGFQADIPLNIHRLGEYRSNPSSAEPALRRSDLVYFDLGAIRISDHPANSMGNPSGFHAEEACALSRTAGMSERVKLFAISDWNSQLDARNTSAQLVSQLIWYFWEGCHLKSVDQNLNKEQLTRYLVDVRGLDQVLKFYKSEQSGKWWFEEPLVDPEFSNPLIPCTYEEYLAAAKDQIPHRILELISG